VSAGKGAKGHRWYDWAFLRLDPARDSQAGQHWLLVRRHQRTGKLAFCRCWMPRVVPLAILVRIAGQRWRIEEFIKTGKGLVGLDQHQVRRWRSWYRWATLAVLAHAFLVVAALTEQTRHPGTVQAGRVDLQRAPAPVRRPGRSARWGSRPPMALVWAGLYAHPALTIGSLCPNPCRVAEDERDDDCGW
jgi:hypothetical protein